MLKSSYEEFYGNVNKRFKFVENESQNSSVLNPSETSVSSIDDLNRSNASSPLNSTPSTNNLPLSSITNHHNHHHRNINKTNTAPYPSIPQQHNYYQNPAGYENYHFQPYLMPQFYPHQQQYFHPAAQHNPIRNHRSSIGAGSSTDTSSGSLNSPSQMDENLSRQNQVLINGGFNGYKGDGVSTTPLASSVSRVKPEEEGNDEQLPLKKRRPVPVEQKDPTYWEKRKKNNESAKRSRDMRRCKEEQISTRVVYLEQENLQLRTEVALLRSETEKLRSMLYANNLNPITGAPNLHSMPANR